MARWTDEELKSTVRAYLKMLSAQDQGLSYSKADTRRQLRRGPLKARSEASIEYRMRNITAVLQQHGRPLLKGYIAAANVGEAVSRKIWEMVREMDAAPPSPSSGSGAGAALISKASRSGGRRRPPIIYFNIGWMKRYEGPAADDPTIGAHGYLGSHDHGAECYNFAATDNGLVRGYRPPGERTEINLNRLGAQTADPEVEGALVVWLAREPATGRTLVAGWYLNAKVFRRARDGGRTVNGETICYSVEARKEDATLLPPVARTFEVRSSRVLPGGGFGQNPTWYGSDAVDRLVRAYVQSRGTKGSPGKRKHPVKPPKNFDPELRRKVERAAVEHATAYYKAIFGNDCPVVSVEKEAKGWDLEVSAGRDRLLIEVKGLLNAGLMCELTPNEYAKMTSTENRSRYVVFVVNNALAEPPAAPVASIFEHAGGMTWRTADGRELKIIEKTGAVLSAI